MRLRLRVPGFEFIGSIRGLEFQASNQGVSGMHWRFRVLDFGFPGMPFGFRVSGFGFRVSDLGFRVSGFGFRFFAAERARDLF